MTIGRLTSLQVDVLRALASLDPPWRLAGGGALVGFHTQHRDTRDLDLFWQARELGSVGGEVVRRLEGAGMAVQRIQHTPTFQRLSATRGTERVLVDLVAEPTPVIEPPVECAVEGTTIRVDTTHELLVSKLCALLSRSELRDLQDVQALLAAGGDLARALHDAPRKDGGFSPVTLAWLLEQFPLVAMARALGTEASEQARLEAFRADLARQLLSIAKPA